MSDTDFESNPRRAAAVGDAGPDADLGLAAAVLKYHREIVEPEDSGDLHDDWDAVEVPRETWEAWIGKAAAEEALASPVVRKAMHRFTEKFAEIEAEKPFDLALVACSESKYDTEKLGVPVEARRLYIGQTFILAIQVAAKLARQTRILSAFHGVVHPEQKIHSYDRQLSTAKRALQAWAEQCRQSLHSDASLKVRGRPLRVLMLAPSAYATAAPRGSVVHYAFRVGGHAISRGLGIGEQKAWLKKALNGEVAL